MLDKCTPGNWDYIGDHIVGVVGDCNCQVKPPEVAEGEMVAYPDRAHEAHDVVPPVIEDDLPEGVTMEEHMANCHLIAGAKGLFAVVQRALEWAARPDVKRGELNAMYPGWEVEFTVAADKAKRETL